MSTSSANRSVGGSRHATFNLIRLALQPTTAAMDLLRMDIDSNVSSRQRPPVNWSRWSLSPSGGALEIPDSGVATGTTKVHVRRNSYSNRGADELCVTIEKRELCCVQPGPSCCDPRRRVAIRSACQRLCDEAHRRGSDRSTFSLFCLRFNLPLWATSPGI
jgi:hypothetical protein